MFACNAQFSMHRGRQRAAPNGLPDAGPGGAPKGASPGLGGRAEHLFFFRIVFAKRKNLCMFACNAQFSMRRGRQRAAPNGLPDAGPGGAPNGASPGLGGRAEPLFFFRIVFAKRKNLCMFVSNAQFSMRRGRQRAAPNGLPDAGPGGAPNGASPGLGGRAEPLFFFRIVFAKRKYLCMFVSNAQFSMHPGRQSAAPNALPDAGPGDAPNGASPGLAAGKYVKFLCRVMLAN